METICGLYLFGLAHGDLGQSISQHAPVARLIREHYPATLELAGAGLFVAIIIAFPLGIIAGADAGGPGDAAAMGFAILGISVPHIYLGPLLMIVFSLDLGWLPLTGRGGFAHLVLPALTMGTALAAILARMLRQCLVRVSSADYMRTARSKGLSRKRRTDSSRPPQCADARYHAARTRSRSLADRIDCH